MMMIRALMTAVFVFSQLEVALRSLQMVRFVRGRWQRRPRSKTEEPGVIMDVRREYEGLPSSMFS
jgi:hypothetical protein